MSKIRVLYTIPNFDTAGSGKALLNIAMRLDKNRFEPHILCLHDRGDFFEVVRDSGIPIHVFDYLPKARPFLKMFTDSFKISRKIRDINPDIVHSFHYNSNYTEGLAVRMAGAKWVFTKKNMSWGGASKNGWRIRSLLANGIAVQNTDMVKQFYPNSNKTALIPRGVVVENFKNGKGAQEILAKMGTNENQRVVICVANFVPVKGIEILIQAFQKLHNDFPEWVLWLVGDDQNDYGKELHQIVEARNLSNCIFFSGKQINVLSYLNHAEIFVLPTLDKGRREGSPVALLEAMVNGKVVVASNVPGVRDQLKDFQDYLFPSGDVEHLASLLRLLMIKSKEELQKQGKLFRDMVKDAYSIEKEVLRHENFYETVYRG